MMGKARMKTRTSRWVQKSLADETSSLQSPRLIFPVGHGPRHVFVPPRTLETKYTREKFTGAY